MALSKTARLGLTRWTEDTDPWNRDDFDDDNAALEALAAIARVNTYANRGSAATYSRSLFFASDQKSLWFSDGTVWRRLVIPNLSSWPMHASIPRGSALAPLAGPQLGISSIALSHIMPLDAGMTIDSIVIARGTDGSDLYTKWAYVTIYDNTTGAKIVSTNNVVASQFFRDTTLTMPFAAPWQVPTTGRYNLVLVLGTQTAGNVETQVAISGAAMPSTLANTAQLNLSAGVDTPAEMPANASAFGGVVPIAGVPWLGFSVST